MGKKLHTPVDTESTDLWHSEFHSLVMPEAK